MTVLVAGAMACGAAVTGSDAGRDAAGECPSRGVAPGVACAAGAPVCLGDDGCNDCSCAGGVWVCATQVCNRDAGTCPAGRPRTGDACAVARQVCDYGLGCSGAHCVCAGGRWTCDTLVCDGG